MTSHDKKRIALAKKARKLAAQAQKLQIEVRALVEAAEMGYQEEVMWNKGQYHAGWIPLKKSLIWEAMYGVMSDLNYAVNRNEEH